jgi:hypothetical protein
LSAADWLADKSVCTFSYSGFAVGWDYAV